MAMINDYKAKSSEQEIVRCKKVVQFLVHKEKTDKNDSISKWKEFTQKKRFSSKKAQK